MEKAEKYDDGSETMAYPSPSGYFLIMHVDISSMRILSASWPSIEVKWSLAGIGIWYRPARVWELTRLGKSNIRPSSAELISACGALNKYQLKRDTPIPPWL
ncbi:hypothetical protein [Desulfonatronum sp. SC1]|uniref:hypothetical protein n=1 Tax=Desulfonatronum sp. SC1 TaxID=2109626 RepID=UPI001304CE07|nr:hypothetical protein [Desulfonatronum sp. SC1]